MLHEDVHGFTHRHTSMYEVHVRHTHTYCIKYLGDNDSEGKAILQNILLFLWPVVDSTGETKRKKKEQKNLNAGERVKQAHLAS